MTAMVSGVDVREISKSINIYIYTHTYVTYVLVKILKDVDASCKTF